MNTHQTIRALIKNTLQHSILLTKREADDRVTDILKIIVTNGKYKLESSISNDGTYSGLIFYQLPREFEFRCFSFIVSKEDCSLSDMEIPEPFNSDIVNRPLKQLSVMVDGLLMYNQTGGYTSLEKLHEALHDLNYFVSKVNAAAKYETK